MLDLHQPSWKSQKWEGSLHGVQEPLGPNNIGNMAATAENKLINAAYRGEGRHWDFEGYATLHKEQHTILEGLKEYGYAQMDEGSKTRHLLAGIKTTALDSVKTQILCNAELRQDRTKCVVLFKDYIIKTKVNKPQELNISSTATKTETEQKKGSLMGELRIGLIPFRNTRLYPMNRRRN